MPDSENFYSMNSFILIAKDQIKKDGYIEKFCVNQKISPFDKTTITTDTPSIGIEIIRDMQKGIFFKPFKGEKKIIIIKQAEKLTQEAQNALLKILEEPPLHTFFFLSATAEQAFLPTILSRCKVVVLEEENVLSTPEEEKQLYSEYRLLMSNNIGAKLSLAEKLATDREKSRLWIEKMISVLHQKLIENSQDSREVAKVLYSLQETYQILQTTNVNLRLLLEHTFLNM